MKIEYPEDKLYLRVRLLFHTLKSCLDVGKRKHSWDARAYMFNIDKMIKADASIDEIKRIESHLISNDFINQPCFNNTNCVEMKQEMIGVIRDYKLRMIL